MVDAARHPKVDVRTFTEVKRVEGYIGNYKTTVKAKDGEKVLEHGVVLVATGIFRFCPLYVPLKIDTSQKQTP